MVVVERFRDSDKIRKYAVPFLGYMNGTINERRCKIY